MRKPLSSCYLALLSLLVISGVQLPAQASHCPGIHTWHNISTSEGTWAGTLTVINQKGSFVNENCEPVERFEVSADQPFKYGMHFEVGSDFNFTYTLAMAKQASFDLWPAKRPICHYIISAYGPGIPQLLTTPVNDAVCATEDEDHRGVNFVVN